VPAAPCRPSAAAVRPPGSFGGEGCPSRGHALLSRVWPPSAAVRSVRKYARADMGQQTSVRRQTSVRQQQTERRGRRRGTPLQWRQLDRSCGGLGDPSRRGIAARREGGTGALALPSSAGPSPARVPPAGIPPAGPPPAGSPPAGAPPAGRPPSGWRPSASTSRCGRQMVGTTGMASRRLARSLGGSFPLGRRRSGPPRMTENV
jgi:hypothetical protein